MREVARNQPPNVAYAVGATTPTGRLGEVVWSTAANQHLQWRGSSWMLMPRLAVAADGAPPAIAAAGSVGSWGVAADAGHTHAHGNQAGGALHALADVNNHGFLSNSQWQIIQSLGLGTTTSSGAADAGKIPKLDANGALSVSFIQIANPAVYGLMSPQYANKLEGIEAGANATVLTAQTPSPLAYSAAGSPGVVQEAALADHIHPAAYASDTTDGLLAGSDYANFSDMRLPPFGKINRQWVPNANTSTYDDRGWGAATWGTPGVIPVSNTAAGRFSRIRYSTTTTTNAGAGVSGALNVQRAATTGVNIGGFRFTARFRIQALATTNQWFFIGLYAGGTWTGATLPTAIPNCIGFYVRNNQLTYLSVPATTTSFSQVVVTGMTVAQLSSGAEVYIGAPFGSSGQVSMLIRPLDTEQWFGGGMSGATLVTAGVPLGPMCAMSASTNAVAASAEIGVMTLQSEH